jgi:hypothetical protein
MPGDTDRSMSVQHKAEGSAVHAPQNSLIKAWQPPQKKEDSLAPPMLSRML